MTMLCLMLSSFLIVAAFVAVGSLQLEATVSTNSLDDQPTLLSRKPVILLDVDGVINFIGDVDRVKKYWSDATEIVISVPNNENSGLREFNIVYSPTVVCKLNEWSNIADIHWLTSWGERTNEYLVPAIGLEGPFATLPHDIRNETGLSKIPCAQAFSDKLHPDRLIIWLEDALPGWVDIPLFGDQGLPRSHNGKCPVCGGGPSNCWSGDVLVRPNTLYVGPYYGGLKPEHVALVDKYLSNPELVKDQLIYAFKESEGKEDGTTVLRPRVFTKRMLETTPQVTPQWCP